MSMHPDDKNKKAAVLEELRPGFTLAMYLKASSHRRLRRAVPSPVVAHSGRTGRRIAAFPLSNDMPAVCHARSGAVNAARGLFSFARGNVIIGLVAIDDTGGVMLGEHHRLLDEFPQYRQKIHDLKLNDRHFSRLCEEYDKLDKEIYRIEERIETPPDAYTEELKKKRLLVKDRIYAILSQV
jgi:uncharacterized protein YdcH (DUF465 family)